MGVARVGPLICSISPSSYNSQIRSMQSLCDLSHLVIIFQKAQSHISMVLFVAQTLFSIACVKSSRPGKNTN